MNHSPVMFALPVRYEQVNGILRKVKSNNLGLVRPPPPRVIGRVRMVVEMDRTPPPPVKDPPNLVRVSAFSLDRLLSHIDPGTEEEAEEFVRRIYEQRHTDVSSERNGQTGS